ncbi:hypothetical protein RJT34_07192 [Clitoria ternatea]|uniref:Uncharacterized protein n=1 Tax=Clitoria ternatea TaxID=43366 RepID=A0AAN9K329_CLITE
MKFEPQVSDHFFMAYQFCLTLTMYTCNRALIGLSCTIYFKHFHSFIPIMMKIPSFVQDNACFLSFFTRTKNSSRIFRIQTWSFEIFKCNVCSW